MSFVAKLFGIDLKAQKRAAEAQAEALRQQAAQTKQQSMAIADQAAAQTRLAQQRSQVQDQIAAQEQGAPDTTPTVDVVQDLPTASRRRKAYQSSAAIRI